MKKLGYIILFLITASAYGQLPNGSYSLIHTQTARTYEPGRLELKMNMNFYTKLADYINDPSLKPADYNALNMWVSQGNINLTYGIVNHLDFTLATMIYQSTQTGDKYNLPDNVTLMMKLGNYAFAKRMFMASAILSTKFFTGNYWNYPFAQYQSGGLEYGLTGALTYFSDPYLPERALSVSLNLGWWNHNDAGREVYGKQTASVNATEFQYGVGLVYPTEKFDFILEMNGMTYLTQPDSFVYSRDDWMYVSPAIRYKALPWMSIDLGVDIRLSSGDFSSYRAEDLVNRDLPVYSTWKVQLGANFKILPMGVTGKTASEREREVFNKRVDYFQNIIKERDESENIQQELDKLKEERKQAEEELEELKQILQEEGN